MKNRPLSVQSSVVALLVLFLSSTANAAGLLDLATDTLGVTPQQAEGGMGALLSSAKGNMGAGQYSQFLSMVPSLSGLADAAPPAMGGGSSLGGLASSAGSLLGGSSGGSLAGIGQLTQIFEGLGLSPEMVGQFSDLLLDYVQREGGKMALDMLKGALPL
jgi:hypothetical protein